MPDCSEIANDLELVNTQIEGLLATKSQAEMLLTSLSELAQGLQILLFECEQGGEPMAAIPADGVVPAGPTITPDARQEKMKQVKKLAPYLEAMQRGADGACVILGVDTKK